MFDDHGREGDGGESAHGEERSDGDDARGGPAGEAREGAHAPYLIEGASVDNLSGRVLDSKGHRFVEGEPEAVGAS